jgi:hypothetical protein
MKLKIYFFCILSFFGVIQLQAQTNFADWLKILESTGESNSFNNIVYDGQDYILNGFYSGLATFNGQTLPQDLGVDAIITKVNADGESIWTTTVNGSGINAFYDLALDSENNIIVVGWTSTYDILYVNGDPVFTENGEYINRAMVMKLSGLDGSLIWFKTIAATEYQTLNCTRLAIDESDNIYVAGYYNCPFQVDAVEIPYNKMYGDDIFMLKLDEAGIAIWGQYFPAETDGGYAMIRSVAVNSEALYFSIEYSVPLIVNGNALPHTGDYYWLAIAGASKETGIVENIIPFGSAGGQAIKQIKMDNDNNVVAVGFHSSDFPLTIGTITLEGKGYEDGFVCKLNNNLEVLWAKTMGGEYTDQAFHVQVDEHNNILIGGGFDCFTDFYYDGVPVLNSNAPNSLSAFYIITDETGNFIQSTGLYADNVESVLSFSASYAFTNVDLKEVYCTGNFNGTVSFIENEPLTVYHNTGYFYKWEIPFVSTSIENTDNNILKDIYPNPVNDLVWINPSGNKAEIEIYNAIGILVYTDQIESITPVSFEMFPSGNYFIKIETEKTTQTFKMIKK